MRNKGGQEASCLYCQGSWDLVLGTADQGFFDLLVLPSSFLERISVSAKYSQIIRRIPCRRGASNRFILLIMRQYKWRHGVPCAIDIGASKKKKKSAKHNSQWASVRKYIGAGVTYLF